jgi:hypothetical protein
LREAERLGRIIHMGVDMGDWRDDLPDAQNGAISRLSCILAVAGCLLMWLGTLASVMWLPGLWIYASVSGCTIVGCLMVVPLVRADERLTAERDRRESAFRQSGPDLS